ncbi:MAG: FG-GAP repeat domain-containing protein [Chloroflexota bacterium]
MRKTLPVFSCALIGIFVFFAWRASGSSLPRASTLTARVAWAADTFLQVSTHDQVVCMPAVADINRDDMPEIVFSSYQGQNYDSDGVLRALRGDNGDEVFSVTDAALRVRPLSSPVLIDLENDGDVEIVVERSAGGLYAFDHLGALQYTSVPTFTLRAPQGSALAVADLDLDGYPEIVAGRYVLDHTLSHVVTLGAGNDTLLMSIVGDVNLDGSPDVIMANTVYSGTGGVLHHNAALPALASNALGNFDADPYPEIVLVTPYGGGQVYLLDHQLQVVWGPAAVPGGGEPSGGPPTVADFDGDGFAEIGVSGANAYTVFDANGDVLMQRPGQDLSSGFSVASAFDLDGNGAAEVIYADETTFYIHDVLQPTDSFSTTHASITGYEIPVVADVDADRQAEIVVAEADAFCHEYGCTPGFKGVRVFEAAGVPWANVRRLWHQHAYDTTSVDDSLRIVSNPLPVWQSANTFRGQVAPPGGGVKIYLPLCVR